MVIVLLTGDGAEGRANGRARLFVAVDIFILPELIALISDVAFP